MIEYINNWYWNNYPKFRPSDLLDMIEREGMEPPEVKVINLYDNSEDLVNAWEPEDEKK